jgi:hypothetical protein
MEIRALVITKGGIWVYVKAKDILQIYVCVCVCIWEDYTFKFYKPNCITYFTQSFTLNAMHIKHKHIGYLTFIVITSTS